MPPTANCQSTAFRRDGFVTLDRFLDAADLVQVRSAVDRLVASPPHETACSRPHNTLLPLRWNDPIVRHLLNSERRARILSDCLGADDLRWISGYVSIKEPHSPPLWWHQDWWCWDHPISYRPAAPQVAVLCYLSTTDERGGALRVLPGSHHRGSPIHALLPEPHSTGELDAGHIAMSDHSEQETLRLQAGDAVAIDYRLLHGTHENASDARRDCILLSFTPSWQNLPEEVRGHLISHPALPSQDECPSEFAWETRWLPRFHGPRRDLFVNRRAPACFEIDGLVTGTQP